MVKWTERRVKSPVCHSRLLVRHDLITYTLFFLFYTIQNTSINVRLIHLRWAKESYLHCSEKIEIYSWKISGNNITEETQYEIVDKGAGDTYVLLFIPLEIKPVIHHNFVAIWQSRWHNFVDTNGDNVHDNMLLKQCTMAGSGMHTDVSFIKCTIAVRKKTNRSRCMNWPLSEIERIYGY